MVYLRLNHIEQSSTHIVSNNKHKALRAFNSSQIKDPRVQEAFKPANQS
jgi:hypothetical protein